MLLCLRWMPSGKETWWIAVINQKEAVETIGAHPTTAGLAFLESDKGGADPLISHHHNLNRAFNVGFC